MKPSRTLTPNHGEPKLVPIKDTDTDVSPVVQQNDFPLVEEVGQPTAKSDLTPSPSSPKRTARSCARSRSASSANAA